MRGHLLPVMLVGMLCLSGCTRYVYRRGLDGRIMLLPDDDDIVLRSHEAARILVGSLRRAVPQDEPVLVASFVNIDNLQESSTFGRIIAEQVAGGLAQQGMKIIEMKLRQEGVFVKEREGEFLLSRELQVISEQHEAAAVLVGTYAVAGNIAFVTARIVQVSDSSVLAAHSYSLPLGYNTQSLLHKPEVMEPDVPRRGRVVR